MTASALDRLHPLRRKLAVLLKKNGEFAVEDAVRLSGAAPGSVRQHLAVMRAEGLIEMHALRGRAGRPRHVYTLTLAGEALFPYASSAQLTNLLRAIDELDGTTRERLIRRTSELYAAELSPRFAGRTFEEQVLIGQEILAGEGFLPVLRPLSEGGWQLTLFHCPFYETARKVPSLCESELLCQRLLMPGGEVTRIGHRLNGLKACTYLIRPGDGEAGMPRANGREAMTVLSS